MADEHNAQTIAAGRMDGWRARLLAQRPVVNVWAGQEMGRVADIVFDPELRQVSGLLLDSAGRGRALGDLARRAFGGTLGLTYIELERIIALNADVVTVDLQAAVSGSGRARLPRPRLGAVLGFSVVTILGQRLGRLADLLLDAEGRRILAYLVESEAGPNGGDQARRQVATATRSHDLEWPEVTAPDTSTAPEVGEVTSRTVPASQDVRVGRDLIIVASGSGAGAADDSASGEPQIVHLPGVAGGTGDDADAPTRQRWESDAPTEQRHR